MQNTKIVLLCENNHKDPLMLLAKYDIYNKFYQSTWNHSLMEHTAQAYTEEVEADFCSETSYGVRSPFLSICPAPDETYDLYCLDRSLSMTQQYQYNAHYIDYSGKEEFLDNLNLCSKLEMLGNLESDSIPGAIHALTHGELDKIRDAEIVSNIKKVIIELGNEKAIGSIGRAHCVDLYHDISGTSPLLLDKITFLNINSDYFDKYEYNESMQFIHGLKEYCFENCLEEFENSKLLHAITTHHPEDFEEEEGEKQKEAEFLNSPLVIDVNISVSGEDGTMKPWEVASFSVFHN